MPQAETQEREPTGGDVIRIPARHVSEVQVRADSFDEEARTVEIIWAAGAKVKRYSWDEGYYMEELSMDPAHIRMDRFAAGMSLLDAHESWTMADRLGTVIPSTVRIEGGKGYATVKLSRKQAAEELLQDLRDGHPFPVSVGYKTHAYEKREGDGDALPTLRAIDWEPLELSAVPIPADPGAHSRSEDAITVAVIRRESASTATQEGSDMPRENANDQANKPGAKKPGVTEATRTETAPAGAEGAADGERDEDDEGGSAPAPATGSDEGSRRESAATGTQRRETPRQPAPAAPAPAPVDGQEAQRATEETARRVLAEERQRADEITSIAQRYNLADHQLTRDALRNGTGVQAFRQSVVDHLFEEQDRTGAFPMIETRGMQDEVDTRRSAVVNAMLHRVGVEAELSDAAREWRGMSAMDIAKEMMRARGENTRGSINEVATRAFHTTSDFPYVMGEVTRATLLAGYTGVENTFQFISNRNVVSDFREIRVLELGDNPELLKVNEHGEFKRGTMRESEESFKIETYGRIIGFTRQMLINDQLGAFARVAQNWGRKVAKLEGDVVWSIIINNAMLKSDQKPLFHADHGNLAGAGSYLTVPALKAARKSFRKQVDLDGEQIALPPKYLFVGTELEVEAQTLVQAQFVPNTQNEVTPEAIKSLVPVYEPRIDLVGDYAWFLFAALEAVNGRGLQHAYLSGQEQPFYEDRVGFDVDGIEYKVRHDFGAGLTDYRFAYKNSGAAPS